MRRGREEGTKERILVKIQQVAVRRKVQQRNGCWEELSFVVNTGPSSKLEEER